MANALPLYFTKKSVSIFVIFPRSINFELNSCLSSCFEVDRRSLSLKQALGSFEYATDDFSSILVIINV